METKTGLFDKKNQEIHIGDTIRFKNHSKIYYFCFVRRLENGLFYPFVKTDNKRGLFVAPCDCEIVKK